MFSPPSKLLWVNHLTYPITAMRWKNSGIDQKQRGQAEELRKQILVPSRPPPPTPTPRSDDSEDNQGQRNKKNPQRPSHLVGEREHLSNSGALDCNTNSILPTPTHQKGLRLLLPPHYSMTGQSN